MLAGLLDAGGQSQHVVLGKPAGRDNGYHFRPALGQRSGLVDHERVDLFHALQRLGILDQYASLCAPADAHHDGHRSGKAERARAGDDQHRDRGHQAVGEARLRTESRPGRKRGERDDDHSRHEPAGHPIGQPRNGRARALRGRDHRNDPRQHGVASDLLGAHDEAAGRVQRPGDHFRAGVLGNRHGLAGDHRFVDRGASLRHFSVDRDFLAGTHTQAIADRDHIERDIFLGAICAHPPRCSRRQVEQRADGAGGLLPRPQLQDLPEQDEHGDHRCGFEIDRDGAVRSTKCRREELRHRDRDDAVEPRHAGAHRDQREHVEIARDHRLPAAHEEWPATPEHDRSGEKELDPVRPGLVDQHVEIGEVSAHLQHHDRDRQHEPDPESPRHVGELGIGPGFGGDELRLERHAADRAGAGSHLTDLGMHRAGIDGAFRDGLLLLRLPRGEVLGRIGSEPGQASGRAEVICATGMIVPMAGGVRVDDHSADGIAHPFSDFSGRATAVRMAMLLMRLGHVAAAAIGCHCGSQKRGVETITR